VPGRICDLSGAVTSTALLTWPSANRPCRQRCPSPLANVARVRTLRATPCLVEIVRVAMTYRMVVNHDTMLNITSL
jgi:hypothetical protein